MTEKPAPLSLERLAYFLNPMMAAAPGWPPPQGASYRSGAATGHSHAVVMNPATPEEVAAMATELLELRSKAALTYPEELSPELDHALGMMMWNTQPIASVLRENGASIPPKAEREQAAALHWLIKLVLERGPSWKTAAEARLRELRGEPPAA